ncbi:MAG TPA: type II toxin-antitoxin system VapC family toxin [Ktedonobacteraceae bacterium]|jgi:predicted nucleic acid-binding protein|nr:type II toxin-antitoxin system VapC family toxin [Ktedonobacteraceae bacterium]
MTDIVVVDASLALKWVLSETDSNTAIALLQTWNTDKIEIIAPALFTFEATNILYRQVVTNKLSYEEVKKLLTKLLSIGILFNFVQHREISIRAMELSHRFGLPAAYDAHYLALAEHEKCEYWTADTRLWNAVADELPWVRRLSDHQSALHYG